MTDGWSTQINERGVVSLWKDGEFVTLTSCGPTYTPFVAMLSAAHVAGHFAACRMAYEMKENS